MKPIKEDWLVTHFFTTTTTTTTTTTNNSHNYSSVIMKSIQVPFFGQNVAGLNMVKTTKWKIANTIEDFQIVLMLNIKSNDRKGQNYW